MYTRRPGDKETKSMILTATVGLTLASCALLPRLGRIVDMGLWIIRLPGDHLVFDAHIAST